jgi:hypothetical protein
MGVTSLSADFGRFSDFDVNGDDADTFGLQMVQDLESGAARPTWATVSTSWTETVRITTTSMPS